VDSSVWIAPLGDQRTMPVTRLFELSGQAPLIVGDLAMPRFSNKAIDVLIGTFCIENGHELLDDEPDFDPMGALLRLTVVG
jgi:hypothetical protein